MSISALIRTFLCPIYNYICWLVRLSFYAALETPLDQISVLIAVLFGISMRFQNASLNMNGLLDHVMNINDTKWP